MRINQLVNEALIQVEAANAAHSKGQDPSPYLARANEILKHDIGKHQDRKAFFSNKKSPFLEVYIELLRKVDEAMYPLKEDYGVTATDEPTKPPLAERFANIRRKKVPSASQESETPTPEPRTRPPIPKIQPLLKMPEPSKPRHKATRSRGPSQEITAPMLHKLLLDHADKVLIIDIRDRSTYDDFHIDVPHSTCLEFFSIPGAQDEQDLEDSLVVAPQQDQNAFKFRHSARLVVLVDDPEDPHPAIIDRIKSLLPRLKIMVLVGGVDAWISHDLPTVHKSPSPEPPAHTPFTEQLVQDGMVFIRGGMIQPRMPAPSGPMALVNYPPVSMNGPQGAHSNGIPNGGLRGSYAHRPPPVPPVHMLFPGEQVQKQPTSQPPQHIQGYQGLVQNQQLQVQPNLQQPPAPIPPQFAPEILCGLKNLGNTCYMNCVLQCLFGTSELMRPFIDGSYQRYINPRSRLGYSGRLAHEFSRLAMTVAQARNSYVAPFELKQLAGQLQETFLGYDQQDCQEFLTFILDGLHEDLNSRGDAPHEPPLTESQEQVRESYDVRVAAAVEWERYMKTNASLIVDEIQGQYASRLECSVCHATSTTYTAFSTLTLPLARSIKPGSIDLLDCFKAFLAPQVLEGDNAWFCPRCKRKQKAMQYLKISRLPKILIIHLKRFRQKRSMTGGLSADKLEVNVRYPLHQLDLTKYWTKVQELSERDEQVWQKLPARDQTPPFIYDLYAITSHHGSLRSGHYTAFVKKEPNGWFYFDDTNVVPLRDNTVVSRNAYVLFYRRREHLR